jgi:flagellar M-ring protein FliF
MAVVAFDSAKLNGAVSRTRQYLAGFTPGQKTISALAALGLVIGGALFVTHASGPSYTVLYSNLQSSQAGQVTQKLTSDHVPYELQDGGATVLVPETDVNQERISLAEAGLPSGGTITFQTLASTGITSSQFVQNVDYQEALEGQLASTIESIQGIQNAQVSLVMPDTSSFAIANTQTPTASVLVDLTDGTELSSDQVQGIVHLVASSVPSLDANNVTVVDNNGNVLSAPGVDASASTGSAETTAYENQLAASLTALLSRVVGPDNAAVEVHAVLNFDQETTTTNGFEVDKNGKPITTPTSQSTTKETYTGSGAGAQASGALGSSQASTGTNQNGSYTSTQTQTQNAVGQVSQTVQQAPGQVTQTSVAVLVNSSAVKKSQLPALQSLVVSAAGLNLEAGDNIVLTALPFSPAAQPAKVKPPTMVSKVEGDAPDVGLLLLIAAFFFLALRSSKKRRPVFEEIPMLPYGSPASPIEVDTGELPVMAPLTAATLAVAGSPVTREVDAYINTSPDEVAQLMRAWSQERSARSGS